MYIVSIAGRNLLADVCSQMVPSLCLCLTNSVDISFSHAQYIGKECNSTDDALLHIIGRDRSNIIPGRYIYSLQESTYTANRSDFDIENDIFLLCVVGNRLSEEIDESFLSVLENILSENIHIAFIGNYSNYDVAISANNRISPYSHYLGYCDNLQSVISICDLFVNPIRVGGSTSAVMAISAGVPVITTPYGDIATAVGDDFTVPSLIIIISSQKCNIKPIHYDSMLSSCISIFFLKKLISHIYHSLIPHSSPQ